MTLNDLVSIYNGSVLFSVRESESEDVIISFKSGEQDALKDDLLARTVETFEAEVNVTGDVVKKTYGVVIAVYLAAASNTSDDAASGTTTDSTEETA